MNIIDIHKLIPAYHRILVNAGNIVLRFSKDRFVHKNFIDTTREAWQPRKRKAHGSLLVRTGTLKRSIRIISRSPHRIIIGTDVPYAKIHNEGGTIKEIHNVRTHSRRRSGRTHNVKAFSRNVHTHIPARPFLKPSTFLEKKIERMMEIEITNTLK